MIKKFYTFIFSFLLGIFLASLNFYFFTFYFLLFFSAIFFIFLFSFQKKSTEFFWLFLIAGFALLFSSFYYYYFNLKQQGEFDYLLGQKIKQEFIIDAEPEVKKFQTKLVLKFKDSQSRAIFWAPLYPKFKYGDLVQVEGYLLKPKNFKSEQGKEFDYISFLRKDKIYYQIQGKKIKYLASGYGNQVKEKLFELKNSFLNQIKKIIPGQEGSFLGGLLLGAKEDMGKELLEDFRRTGVIHIVVLSGFNLTIVAYFFIKIFAFLGIGISALLASIAIVLFTIMTGASATIVRASLMALLVIFAKTYGREAEMIRILFLVAFLMLLFNPMLLLYDPSFQLSFLATLGLLLLSPKIEDIIKFVPKTIFAFREILAATLATQVFVFPLLLYLMGEISIISPLVNILVLIFIPIVMLIGFLAIIFSYLSLLAGMLIGFVVYLILNYNLNLIQWFADFPYATFSYAFSFWEMLILYFFYFVIFLIYKKLAENKK